MKRARLAALFVVLVLVAVALLMPRSKARSGVTRPSRGGVVMADEKKASFALRLSEGTEETTPAVPVRPAEAHPLSEAEARAVLDRLPELKGTAEDEKDFALREKSLPAPRTGATIADAFPPPEAKDRPDPAAAGPLEVVRHAPDGDVPLAPSLNVTFSQPMVAVTSHDELAAQAVPVKLSPQPPGRWRWVGTKTLLFEPEGRFPMATEYTVEVPAGTKSATGGALAQAVRWSFRTATPTLLSSSPRGGPARRDTLLFPEMLASIQAAAGAGPVRLRLATAEEIQADEVVRALSRAAEPGRWLSFRALEPLPSDTGVTVTIAAGAPSAEGPRRTTAAQDWAFSTYGTGRCASWTIAAAGTRSVRPSRRGASPSRIPSTRSASAKRW
jgi:alpha-2-macroglobulin